MAGSIELEVDTHDNFLVFDILGKRSASSNDGVEVPGNATLTYKYAEIRKAVGIPETIHFALYVGGSVATGLVANWLYDKLKGRAVSVRINRQQIVVDKDKIKEVIEEQIEIKK